MKSELQLFNTSSGELTAAVVYEDGSRRHIHSSVKPIEEYKYFADITFTGDTLIFIGIGIGYHLENCKIDLINSDRKIVVIDYFPEFTKNAKDSIFSKNYASSIYPKSVNKACQKMVTYCIL